MAPPGGGRPGGQSVRPKRDRGGEGGGLSVHQLVDFGHVDRSPRPDRVNAVRDPELSSGSR